MTVKYIGRKHFGPKIDITDPCYDRDVWCRINDLEIKEGDYLCCVWLKKRWYVCPVSQKRVVYDSVARIGIYLGLSGKMDVIGEIGVDAGLAGFFNNKPDYSDDEWHQFCEALDGKDYLINNEGFFASSGDGDGSYPVFAHKDVNGKIDSIEIDFM